MKALKIIGLLLIAFGFLVVAGESDTLSLMTTILYKIGGIAALYLGYKALVKADPSILEENE